jgi:hypothetical protein
MAMSVMYYCHILSEGKSLRIKGHFVKRHVLERYSSRTGSVFGITLEVTQARICEAVGTGNVVGAGAPRKMIPSLA